MNRNKVIWIALWLVLVVITGYFAFFHSPWRMGYGPWHGRGSGWIDENAYPAYRSPGYRSPGRGMAPGWGGGWQGDDGGGAGSGYGMMGPYGGMPGYGPLPGTLPELTPEQAGQIGKLQAEHYEENRALMQQIRQTQARLNELYAADKRDWDAIRGTTRELHELQRRLLESTLDLQQKIDGYLARQ